MNSVSKRLLAAGAGLLMALLGTSSAFGYTAPDYVRVRNITYAGSGCPAGSVAGNIAPDSQAFTLLFDSYVAEAGPGISLASARKNCQLLVDLDFPEGWSYTLFTVDYRGFASLDPGVSGTQRSAYYFQGQATGPALDTTFYGPQSKDYHIRDSFALAAQVWSPCGAQRALNINTSVRVDNSRNRRAAGLLTVDSIDGNLELIYGIQWRRCH